MSSHTISRWAIRHPHTGAVSSLRQFSIGNQNGALDVWCVCRGSLRELARLMGDWDYYEERARRSTGWKNSRCRHQWEHRVIEAEKHETGSGSAERHRFPAREPDQSNGKETLTMNGFVSQEKLSPKARRQLNAQRRVTWAFSPVTRKLESKKHYSRKIKHKGRTED